MADLSKEPEIDERHVHLSRLKRRILKHLWLTRIALLGGFLVLVSLVVFALWKVITPRLGGIASLANSFIFTPEESIKSVSGRTNVLILGKGGAGHAGADLTDTMMVASFSHTGGNLVLISLPRDIWIPDLRAKINSAYYWGNYKMPGGGIPLAKAQVEKVLGLPIQYAVVIDFKGFTKVIDVVGGVTVDVERGFTDTKYPIEGKENDTCGGHDPTYACRYETITFNAGEQEMDGTTALKFVRSRNAEGDEGTDLARAARQQKVIFALEKKLADPSLIIHPSKLEEIQKVIQESIETDIDNNAGAVLARRFLDSRKTAMSTHVIPEDLLINPPISPTYDNQYVFIPKDGTWEEVHSWVSGLLN